MSERERERERVSDGTRQGRYDGGRQNILSREGLSFS